MHIYIHIIYIYIFNYVYIVNIPTYHLELCCRKVVISTYLKVKVLEASSFSLGKPVAMGPPEKPDEVMIHVSSWISLVVFIA